MDSNQLNEFLEISVVETIESLSGLKLENAGVRDEFNHNLSGLSVIVGFLGKQVRGVVAYYFSEQLALHLCRDAFDLQSDTINSEICDACGEIGNIISGCVKKLVVETGLSDYDITVPTVIAGTNYFVNFHGKTNSIVHVFRCAESDEILYAEIKSEKLG